MCLAAVIAFMDGGILGAEAQERPPATRPAAPDTDDTDDADDADTADDAGDAADDAAEADTADDAVDMPAAAEEAPEPSADHAGREPGHRPVDGADTVEDAAVEVEGPAFAEDEHKDAHHAFYECTEAIYSEVRPNDQESHQMVDDMIFEECVPLLPAEEAAMLVAMRPYQECANAIYDEAFADDRPSSEADFEAIQDMVFEQCFDLLPPEQQAEMLAWRNYRECIDAAMGDGPSSQMAYLIAAQSCLDQLPPELAEMEGQSINFQLCMAENGAFDNEPSFSSGGIVVPILTPNGVIQVDFGTGASSVTLSSDGESITATSDGVAVVYEMNFDEHIPVKEAAYEACADLDPYAQDGDKVIVGPIGPVGIPIPIPAVAVVADAAVAVESPVIGLARMAQWVSR